ncbi:hypothetical protein E5288_WYG005397 [Bos mutus]|uniref:Uncharacterized protein n=1 Tax=Bos mutus TaxID=72004 RepID=A0A6B0SEX8_9CETA|nr:hypothetical protein [Bos mutus]
MSPVGPSARPQTASWSRREPQRAGIWLRGARVPGRVAGAPGALRGAPATAAGLHAAAAARGRPAVAAAGSLLRCQPQGPAFPGAAAAPGGGGRGLGERQCPVMGEEWVGGLGQSRASVSPFIAPVQTAALPAVNMVL